MNELEQFWNNLRSSLWFVPALMVACAVAFAAALIELDTHVNHELLTSWPRLFGAGADGSRGMLSAIASSMITVAGVIFSGVAPSSSATRSRRKITRERSRR